MGAASASPALRAGVSILDVLRVDLCARALLDLVPVADLVRSERVCKCWQTAVLHYLRTSQSLGFCGSRKLNSFEFYLPPSVLESLATDFRTIMIDDNHKFRRRTSKIFKKWGHYVKKIIMVHGDNTFLDKIVCKCPNLQQIVIVFYDKGKPAPSFSQIRNFPCLKQISLIGFKHFSKSHKTSDLVLVEHFQNKNYENISIYENRDLTGSFLKSIEPNILKTLSLWGCTSLTIPDLLSAVHNLRSLTNLELEEGSYSMLKDVGLLLKEMPHLEDLQLLYYFNRVPLSEESIEAFSRLVNLKRLTMRGSGSGVNDALIEALARACPKLEYLAINEWTNIVTVRGVNALCRRSPSAVTTLDFTGFDEPLEALQNIFSGTMQSIPVYQELAALGYVELTPEWFRAAASDPRGVRLELNPESGSGAPRGDPGAVGHAPLGRGLDKELKLCIW